MSDDKIAEIKERHFHDERWRNGPSMGCETICPQTHDDRATLLAEVDRLRADLATQQGCCDGAAAQDARVRREREEMQRAKADAWDDGYEAHRQMIEGIARKPSNPYR